MAGTAAGGLVGRGMVEEAGELSDEELLERYLTASEREAEAAFRALVARHGPMVLGTCQQVLHHAQDAEDAFQATFLKLARKGANIRDRRALPGWLHEVAVRTASRLREGSARRQAKEKPSKILAAVVAETRVDDPCERLAWDELRPVLHEEVSRLPEKYRVPVVLSYLEGRTNEEAAALLRWPVGTVKVRLLRARELLRSRLRRRGVGLSAALLATGLHQGRAMADAPTSGLAGEVVDLAMSHRLARSMAESTAAALAEDAAGSGPGHLEARRRFRVSRLVLIAALFLLIYLGVAIGNALAVNLTGKGLAELPGLRDVLAFRPDFNWRRHCVH
jgi:RNA polymerase sigma factor (sigma-70 family)